MKDSEQLQIVEEHYNDNNLIQWNSAFNINQNREQKKITNSFILEPLSNNLDVECNFDIKKAISKDIFDDIFNQFSINSNGKNSQSYNHEINYFFYKKEDSMNNNPLKNREESLAKFIADFSEKNKKQSKKKVFLVIKSDKKRRYRKDNIRNKIVRKFLNSYVIKKINKILGKVDCQIYFKKFPKKFTYETAKKSNKKILMMTFEQMLMNKELYRENKSEKYIHNVKSLNKIKSDEYNNIIEVTGIKNILKCNYCDLFKDYLSSDEFIREINSLKSENKNYDNYYKERYKYLSENFIQNYFD